MKAVLLPGDGTVEVVERPIPVPSMNQVLIKVRSSAICASDLSLYSGNAVVGGNLAGSGKIIPGHEAAGDVVEIGEGVRSVAVGDRVAVHLSIGCMHCEFCRAGYIEQCLQWQCVGFDVDGGDAEYIVVPEAVCLQLPPELSYEAGSVMVDNFGTQYHTQKRLGVSGTDVVTVVGLGPMGAAAVLVAKARGADVIAVDLVPHRLELARTLGADHVVDVSDGTALEQILALTDGRGTEVAIDCSGNAAGENLALDAAARLGRAAFVGESSSATINPSEQFLRKELTVIGGWVFPIYEYDEMVRFILRHGITPEVTVSHRFTLDEAPTAFRMVQERRADKVMFVFDEDTEKESTQ
ncbi:alcohol dehydrogenase catalytic domain-containing protein [Herbiconiux sp. CPCC 205763]|uniref:Alcohol dehydrogenase catalytic domain-containing protein n=1 Tax=Herbiconiux aconitum TaxID=2970913 RepID=A0ABT2GL16_9MICO|nr:alcohol dehydrogenase catalytic domain-containing protein [Herbiconiux aconitum]MCS5716917.1 alcohol dehydrogenase catalytic domain-containing protein [Herbiconiux aconitum]